MAKCLWVAGSIIFIFLGALHLYYTFFSSKFNARNKSLVEDMKSTSPVLTGQTTMWKAWIGFNASHSAGAIFFGMVNMILATGYFEILGQSIPLILLDIITVIFYCWLAKKYWFSIPFIGLLIVTGCFVAASTLLIFSN